MKQRILAMIDSDLERVQLVLPLRFYLGAVGVFVSELHALSMDSRTNPGEDRTMLNGHDFEGSSDSLDDLKRQIRERQEYHRRQAERHALGALIATALLIVFLLFMGWSFLFLFLR